MTSLLGIARFCKYRRFRAADYFTTACPIGRIIVQQVRLILEKILVDPRFLERHLPVAEFVISDL